jgi:hypothetical protein
MAQTPHEVRVKVEIDYEKLSQAIREAIQSSMTVVTSGIDAESAAKAVSRSLDWRDK